MIFETDKQTIADLNLLGKYKPNSIYSLYCRTVTSGGEILLEQMFNAPLVEKEKIEERVQEFQWFKKHAIAFPITSELSEQVEQYLLSKGYNFKTKLTEAVKLNLLELIGNDSGFELWRNQIESAVQFLTLVKSYLEQLDPSIYQTPLGEVIRQMNNVLNGKTLEPIYQYDWKKKLNLLNLLRFDHILLSVLREDLHLLMQLIYRMDVDTVVGGVARERNFCFAHCAEEESVIIHAERLSHPSLVGAVANNLDVSMEKNVFFLTGANMAGKSTLMKSLGISVYLAHMGFPVAASSMVFKVQQGLYTSINVSDNLNMGYSHFYAEVLRVKKVAIEVSRGKRLVVIFDELFKGTNVKDAYDATLAVTSALAKRQNCALMVSTHIIEVADDLGAKCDNIVFEYLPTVMKGSVPTYTYQLCEGITSDKHGMIILNNEHVIDIIVGKNKIER